MGLHWGPSFFEKTVAYKLWFSFNQLRAIVAHCFGLLGFPGLWSHVSCIELQYHLPQIDFRVVYVIGTMSYPSPARDTEGPSAQIHWREVLNAHRRYNIWDVIPLCLGTLDTLAGSSSRGVLC